MVRLKIFDLRFGWWLLDVRKGNSWLIRCWGHVLFLFWCFPPHPSIFCFTGMVCGLWWISCGHFFFPNVVLLSFMSVSQSSSHSSFLMSALYLPIWLALVVLGDIYTLIKYISNLDFCYLSFFLEWYVPSLFHLHNFLFFPSDFTHSWLFLEISIALHSMSLLHLTSGWLGFFCLHLSHIGLI